MDKGQIIRYSNAELALLNGAFADNDELMLALYKHMLQLDLSEQDWLMLKAIKGEMIDVLKKQFTPTFNDDAPLEQRIDLFMTVKTEETYSEDVWISANARVITIKYLKQRIDLLAGEDVNNPISLFELQELIEDKEQYHINLKARNTIINHVMQRVTEIRTLAGKKNETEEERNKRLQLNSNK